MITPLKELRGEINQITQACNAILDQLRLLSDNLGQAKEQQAAIPSTNNEEDTQRVEIYEAPLSLEEEYEELQSKSEEEVVTVLPPPPKEKTPVSAIVKVFPASPTPTFAPPTMITQVPYLDSVWEDFCKIQRKQLPQPLLIMTCAKLPITPQADVPRILRHFKTQG